MFTVEMKKTLLTNSSTAEQEEPAKGLQAIGLRASVAGSKH